MAFSTGRLISSDFKSDNLDLKLLVKKSSIFKNGLHNCISIILKKSSLISERINRTDHRRSSHTSSKKVNKVKMIRAISKLKLIDKVMLEKIVEQKRL